MSRRDEILRAVLETPPLPAAAIKAIPMLQDPHTDMCEIARVLRHDPSLTANILRLANSAAFGARRKIDSIDVAIARLGIRRVLDLVLGSTMAERGARAIAGYDLPAGALLEHCIAVAIGTEELAKLLDRPLPAFAFSAGLLVDIGKSVMGQFLELDGQAVCRAAFEQGISFEQAERSVFDVDHTQIGAALLEHWQLPQSLVDVVRYHHTPEQCPQPHRVVTGIVHMADQICCVGGIGTGCDGTQYKPSAAVACELEITAEVIERTLLRIVERVDGVLGSLTNSPPE